MPRTRIHPGEYLIEEYLEPLNFGADQLADALNLLRSHVDDLVHKRRDVDADLALHLGRFFGTTARFWINLQAAHDLANTQAMTDSPGSTDSPAP